MDTKTFAKYLIIFGIIFVLGMAFFTPVPDGTVQTLPGDGVEVNYVAVTCVLTETINAVVHVAILPESKYTTDDVDIITESVCGVLVHEGTLIFKVTYEVAE